MSGLTKNKSVTFFSIFYQQGVLFNPLLIADELQAIDSDRTSFDQWDVLLTPAFIDERLQDAPIFRTVLDSYLGIYCGDAVKTAIETTGLAGVILTEDLRNMPVHWYANQ